MKKRRTSGRLTKQRGFSLHARGLALWAAALATGMLCVWQHVYSNRLATEITALKERKGSLEAEIGFLNVECARLSGRRRIEDYAHDRLDMRYPRAGEVIRLGGTESINGQEWCELENSEGTGAVLEG